MSKGVAEGYETERSLRRSRRQRKVRTPVVSSDSSGTESIDSNNETSVGWNLGGFQSEVEGNEYSFDEFSNTAQFGYNKKSSVTHSEMSNKESNERTGRTKESVDSGRCETPGRHMDEFMRTYLEQQARRDEMERERREEERREQREREEAARKREEYLFESPREARAVVPPPVRPLIIGLPHMKEGDDIETFIPILEASLRLNEVPCGNWKKQLISQIPLKSLIPIEPVLQSDDSSYQDVVNALMGGSNMTFCSAAEDMCSGERGRLWELDIRSSMTKLKQLVSRVTRDADTKHETVECVVVALMRDWLVYPLKSYVDMSRKFQVNEFVSTCEEWERSQPRGTQCFRKNKVSVAAPGKVGGNGNPFGTRKPLSCFNCGKSGHISRECRSRPQGEAVTAPVATAAPAATTAAKGKGEVLCFRCNGKGHKSPNCPTKPKSNRKVCMNDSEPVIVQQEELFGSIGSCNLSVTVDTGAQISIVPLECVRADQLTGRKQNVRSLQGALVEGEACRVQFVIVEKTFDREAVAVKGDLINWVPCMQIPLTPKTELEYIMELAGEKARTGKEQRYLPIRVQDGVLHSGYLVSGDGDLSLSLDDDIEEPVVVVESTIRAVGEGEIIESDVEERSVEGTPPLVKR